MVDVEIKDALDADDVAELEALLARAEAEDGHRAIDEHRWLDATHGGRSEFAGLLYRVPGHDHPVAYAQVTKGNRSWAVDLVIDPHHRPDHEHIGARLLGEAMAAIARGGGGHVHHWVYHPTEVTDRVAGACGLQPGRELLQMRVPLPRPDPFELITRPFEPGTDEEAWLEVNNAAFEWHPEQGDWTAQDLLEREAEPWFDRHGFLLHERDGKLAGFCWTKVHDNGLGEIYVIAVHPHFHGLGLGRALVLAGLDSLHQRDVDTAMLYVDSTNVGAVALYEHLGFTVHHTDRAYVGDIPTAR